MLTGAPGPHHSHGPANSKFNVQNSKFNGPIDGSTDCKCVNVFTNAKTPPIRTYVRSPFKLQNFVNVCEASVGQALKLPDPYVQQKRPSRTGHPRPGNSSLVWPQLKDSLQCEVHNAQPYFRSPKFQEKKGENGGKKNPMKKKTVMLHGGVSLEER